MNQKAVTREARGPHMIRPDAAQPRRREGTQNEGKDTEGQAPGPPPPPPARQSTPTFHGLDPLLQLPLPLLCKELDTTEVIEHAHTRPAEGQEWTEMWAEQMEGPSRPGVLALCAVPGAQGVHERGAQASPHPSLAGTPLRRACEQHALH